ncbi:GPO family capsid scaffolding protein [Ottowia sp.]|uniref:GPO family capsid scaffolding protein n=1 Tax=Ottowia sp. TaxID=1898956 RepID=UPI003A86DAB7
MKNTKAKRFRVATSGPTIDGREIKADWLTQAADNYDPVGIYAARINVEHLRGAMHESEFGALGDVTALSTENLKDGRVALYADLLPNERAIAANQKGQKVYSSIEIIENFAGTGQAYMVGLALTDSPASLGTQRLAFSTQQTAAAASASAEPFSVIGKKSSALAFAMANPIDFDLSDDDAAADSKLSELFATLRDKFTARFKVADKTTADLAAEVAATLDAFADATATQFDQQGQDFAALQAAHTQLQTDFANLKKQLETTPAAPARKASTGGTSAEVTDC